MTGIDAIIGLIQAEARRRPGTSDYAHKLYGVQQDVHHRVGMILKALREQETEDANKKRG
jgi:hypothetical protein